MNHEFTLLIDKDTSDMVDRDLGPQFHIHEVDVRRKLSVPVLTLRKMLITLRLWPPVGTQAARQLDSLGLDLLHFPAQVIDPLLVKTPCVLSFFDMQDQFFPENFDWIELRYRRHYRTSAHKAVKIISPSEFTKQTLIDKFGVPPEKVDIVHIWASDDFRPPGDPSAAAARIRRKYQLPDEFIYYPATAWPHKNHARLFQAFRILSERYELPHKLVLTGHMENTRTNVVESAEKAGVTDKVIKLGYVSREDLPSLYVAASMLVFPSLFEGFGSFAMHEAMICGCPVACSNTTSLPECVGDAALLFDPFDIEDMAHAMYRVLIDPTLRRELIERGWRRTKMFSWEETARRTLAVYQEAHTLSRAPEPRVRLSPKAIDT